MTDWNKLFEALKVAKQDLETAEMELSAARSKETRATNNVNAAQGAINKAIQEEKKNAPHGSDWHREANPPRTFSVPA